MKKIKLWHSAFSPQFNSNIHPRILENINKWITLNPDLIIERHIVDDKECLSFLTEFDGKNGTETVKYFNYETDGRFKSDLWRLCVLYEYGGIYVDIDQEPLEPIHKFLDLENIDFCCSINPPSNYLCNGFIYVKEPKSKIIKECLNVHLDKYEKKMQGKIGDDMSALHTMCSAIRNMFEDNNIPEGETNINGEKCLFFTEYPDWSIRNDNYNFMRSYAFYYGKLKIMNSRYNSYYIDKTVRDEFIKYNNYEIFNN